ncbi:aminotransferase class V-fold PLP-dependent enzyme [Candidatus Nesciobacter abundans]|uniref:Cysteine desulfurase n=1 Tax=Candidatus Nesciobacter abundans TaxID=2601668 RepID=A0A5C0UIB2_9PROT|nr:aminotransferase class V-fold PLP-dependent enzyme [Candidatus Nesciobacter abundans]
MDNEKNNQRDTQDNLYGDNFVKEEVVNQKNTKQKNVSQKKTRFEDFSSDKSFDSVYREESFGDGVYLDYSATTPCDPSVVDVMSQSYKIFANPHSITHMYGWNATDLVESSRAKFASIIGAESKEIVFTSGATEANNLALKGVISNRRRNGLENPHIITTNIEHKATLETCHTLEKQGVEVTYLEVEKKTGLLDIEKLKKSIKSNTVIISISWVNSEIGVIQPIEEIGNICEEKNIYFHIDAAQALGRIDVDVKKCKATMVSFSAHKFYGPKGIGALYIKKRTRVDSIIDGGKQERGVRSGTISPQLCLGLAKAAEFSTKDLESENIRMKEMQDYLLSNLNNSISDIFINGDMNSRIPHNVNISFACVEGESLMMKMEKYAMSSASACSSQTLQPSYVLSAIGVDEDLIHTSLRMVMGRYTTMEDMKNFTNDLIESVNFLRNISPLWDMKKKGIDLKTVEWHDHH